MLLLHHTHMISPRRNSLPSLVLATACLSRRLASAVLKPRLAASRCSRSARITGLLFRHFQRQYLAFHNALLYSVMATLSTRYPRNIAAYNIHSNYTVCVVRAVADTRPLRRKRTDTHENPVSSHRRCMTRSFRHHVNRKSGRLLDFHIGDRQGRQHGQLSTLDSLQD